MGIITQMHRAEKGFPLVFETLDVVELVGIQQIYLNKCIERDQFGIQASVRTGKGRGKRRLFSQEDLWGVALVWWLFESGLRSATIQFVLNQICGGHLGSRANDAARTLLDRQTKVLAIEREPRDAKDTGEHPKQRVELVDETDAAQLVRGASAQTVLVIPVGNLFLGVRKAIEDFRRR